MCNHVAIVLAIITMTTKIKRCVIFLSNGNYYIILSACDTISPLYYYFPY